MIMKTQENVHVECSGLYIKLLAATRGGSSSSSRNEPTSIKISQGGTRKATSKRRHGKLTVESYESEPMLLVQCHIRK